MGKLLKYELRKTWVLKLIVLGMTAVAEIVFLAGLWAKQEQTLGIGILLLSLLGLGSIMAIGLYSLVVLHRDMNTKQSYMLFMTPNSTYRILGAKVLENGLSTLLAGAVFFALGMLDITLLFAREGRLKELWDTIMQVLHTLDERLVLNVPSLGSFFLLGLCGWFAFVTLTYLADVISSALLNGKKGNGVVTFLLIIALNVLMNWAVQSLMDAMSPAPTVSIFLAGAGIQLVFAVAMYVLTAWIMDRYLSV